MMNAHQSRNKKNGDILTEVRTRLRDPKQARVFATILSLAIAYMGVYSPLSDAIAAQDRGLSQEKNRQQLAQELGRLRDHYQRFDERLPENCDTNEWVQYVLDGIRALPLQVMSLEPGETRSVGPFKALQVKIQVAGQFSDLHALLEWIESNQRLFRVETVKTTTSRVDAGRLEMSLTVLALSR